MHTDTLTNDSQLTPRIYLIQSVLYSFELTSSKRICFTNCICNKHFTSLVKLLSARDQVRNACVKAAIYFRFRCKRIWTSVTLLRCPVGWGCRIHRLHLCRGVRSPTPNECPGYDTKKSDGEISVMLELRDMRSTPILPSLPGALWPWVVAHDKGTIYGLNITNGTLMLNWLDWNKNVLDNETPLILKLFVDAKLNYLK